MDFTAADGSATAGDDFSVGGNGTCDVSLPGKHAALIPVDGSR